MAIEFIQGSQGSSGQSAGPLSLPPGFNTEHHAAKWVKEGPAVLAAAEREFLVGSQNLTADGWQTWKDGPNAVSGKIHKVALSSGNYVLLFRPREIQDAVNAIYGNLGKERMMQERQGETVGGIPVHESGVLGDAQIARVLGKDPELSHEDGGVVLNHVPNVRRVTPQPLEVTTSAE